MAGSRNEVLRTEGALKNRQMQKSPMNDIGFDLAGGPATLFYKR